MSDYRQIGHMTRDAVAAADAMGAGITILGQSETAGNLRNWKGLSAYLTTFTSKAVAEAIFVKSQRHVPVDTEELYQSGFVSTTNGPPSEMDGFSKPTVLNENIEATVAAHLKQYTSISGAVTVPSGYFGPRTFVKYAVGYSADHAAEVHENPFGQKWLNDRPTKSGVTPKYSDRKKDHFLLDAYIKYEHRFSSAMRIGLKQIEYAIGAVANKQAVALMSEARALSSGGKPRLIKRGS